MRLPYVCTLIIPLLWVGVPPMDKIMRGAAAESNPILPSNVKLVLLCGSK